MRSLALLFLIGIGMACLAQGSALAATPPAPPVEKKAPPPKPSSLIGNARPHCVPGTYVAGNFCKPSPPGFYAPAKSVYPLRCPAGTSSPAGSRGLSECK